MKHLMVKDLPITEELDYKAMVAVCGGRFKHPFQTTTVDQLLTTPDGDPIDVYVDGVRVNSLQDGYYHI